MSGAGLQCRALIAACGDRARFAFLSTAVDPSPPEIDVVDGLPVRRVCVHPTSRLKLGLAAPRWLTATAHALRHAYIVHLHVGVSPRFAELHAEARRTAEARLSLANTATAHLSLYRELLNIRTD